MAAIFPDDEVNFETLKEDITNILCKLDGAYWKDKTIVLDNRHGNFNKNFTIHAENDPKRRLFVRLFNPKMEYYLRHNQRNYEFFNDQQLSTKIHCLFKNGCLMDVVEGTPITLESSAKLLEPEVQKAVAEEMARYHSKRVLDAAKEVKFNKGIGWHEEPWMRRLMDSTEKNSDHPNADDILSELNRLNNELERRKSPLAFCHGDPNPSNIIYNPGTKKALFIDYDSPSVTHAVFDMSVYFLTMVCPFDVNQNPTEEYQHQFLRYYITKKNELDAKSNEDLEIDVETVKEDLKISELIVVLHLLSCFYALANGLLRDPDNLMDADWLNTIVTEHWEYYNEQKKVVLG